MALPTTGIGQTGQGAIVSIGGITGAGGTETFNVIGQLNSLSRSGGKRDIIDVSTITDTIKQKIGGIADSGSGTLMFNRMPQASDPGQLQIEVASESQFAYDFKIQLPKFSSAGQSTAGDVGTFSAIVSSTPSFDIANGKVVQYSFDLEFVSDITWTAGS